MNEDFSKRLCAYTALYCCYLLTSAQFYKNVAGVRKGQKQMFLPTPRSKPKSSFMMESNSRVAVVGLITPASTGAGSILETDSSI